MKETHLYIFRHGQTDWNLNKKIQGHSDIPLNDNGRDQARTLSKKIAALPIEAVVSSDLKRAKETAEISLADKNIPIIETQELREIHLGDLEGLSKDDIATNYGEGFLDEWWYGSDQSFCFPNGESKAEHTGRMVEFLKSFIAKEDYGHIAVSTHGGSIHRLVQYCLQDFSYRLHAVNCSCFHIKVSGEEWSFVGEL